MTSDRDDIEASDWLASQFDDEPEPPKRVRPPAQPPVSPGQAPFRPPLIPPAAAPSAVPATPPAWSAGNSPTPPAPAFPPAYQPTSPIADRTQPTTPAAPTSGEGAGGFVWGLTPGGDPTPPTPAPTPAEPTPPPPYQPTQPYLPTQPYQPTPPYQETRQNQPTPPYVPTPPYQETQPYTPTPPYQPTQPYEPTPPSGYPTQPSDRWTYDPLDQPTTAIERAPMPWETPALDYSLQGGTELLSAEPGGLADPISEGAPTSAIDSLFGATQFREYDDDPLIPPPPTRRDDGPLTAPREPRIPMQRTQKILLWVAGSLVAVLALVAVFLLGNRLAPTLRPTPVAVPTAEATPTAAPPGTAVGPVPPGEYTWSELLGGECLEPWESAWQDNYVVVDCATPHRAQLVFRGVFDDAAGTAYPGVEALQARTLPLCSAPTVIDFAAAAGAADIQISSSFAGDEAEWNAGNPSFFCFVFRAGGEPLTGSLAVPAAAQPAA